MSRDDLHTYAQANTPAEISVPNSWPALIVWAVGKFGGGIVFLGMLVYVYSDLQTSNREFVNVIRANTGAIFEMAEQIRNTNDKVDRIDADMRRYGVRPHTRE